MSMLSTSNFWAYSHHVFTYLNAYTKGVALRTNVLSVIASSVLADLRVGIQCSPT